MNVVPGLSGKYLLSICFTKFLGLKVGMSRGGVVPFGAAATDAKVKNIASPLVNKVLSLFFHFMIISFLIVVCNDVDRLKYHQSWTYLL